MKLEDIFVAPLKAEVRRILRLELAVLCDPSKVVVIFLAARQKGLVLKADAGIGRGGARQVPFCRGLGVEPEK